MFSAFENGAHWSRLNFVDTWSVKELQTYEGVQVDQ